MLESQVQRKLLNQLNKFGWFKKWADKFQAGIPDIIGCYEGMFYAIEVKVDYRKVTELQNYELKQLKAFEARTFVVTYNNTKKQYHVNQYHKFTDMEEMITWILKLPHSPTNASATN